ncbi:hypothetical protein HPB47_021892 [Ixodes persulcatus]|uniref:Uncharacterized protein n=1 Tax=Ixodes persulcatus TaxID=34615 RepID=A0AC60QBB8_IXOPE|nr:hypothetical protein HPB47_021892 [Ixodes persulcatus]
MSHFGYVPVFYVKQLGAPSQDFKNRLLTTLQSAIRQVQDVADASADEGLSEDSAEACSLCEQLDKVFLYGLQQPEWGYWPWVRKFTHEESVQEISSLSNVSTGLGQGRAWLFASLNAALLEGYMRSFAQNQKLLKKGYSTDSFLRDVEGVSSLTLSSADGSSGDSHDDGEDSGILSAHVSSTTLASLASPAEEVHIPETCGCAGCAAFLNDERIRRIISLEADYTDLEVIRAPRSRRKKGSEPSTLDGSSAVSAIVGSATSAGFCDSSDDCSGAIEIGAANPSGELTPQNSGVQASFVIEGDSTGVDGGFGTQEGVRDVSEEQVDSGASAEAVCGVNGSESTGGPPLEEDEASIYDGSGETVTACAVQEEQLGKESSSGEVDRPDLVEDVREEDLASLPRRKSGGLDLKVENNSLLFLVLEIFEADDEKLYKMFLSWKRYDGAGRLQPVFLLLSTRNLYLLSPGGEGGPRFVKDSVVPLHNVGLINVEEVVVKDYRLVHWEIDTHPEAGELSPAGATRSGPLMWRFLENQSKKEKKKQWESSYFLLRAGVLYRFRCPEDTIASSSYLISSSGCGASQPATEAGRPHTLQLNMGPKGACLQLAASNQADLELWAQAFRRAAQHPGRPADQGGLVACCLVLVGDLVLTLVEGGRVLGRGGVVDIGLVRSEDVFCVLEFESGEAESCCFNWILWFSTEEEKKEFLAVISSSWQDIFKVSIDITHVKNNNLRSHCLERAAELSARISELQALCLDV